MIYDGDILERDGLRFRVNIKDDYDHGAPWEDDDGAGVVSDWTTRDKKPGERLLCSDRSSKRFFDWKGTIAKARADGWGLGADALAELTQKLGQVPTKGQIVEAAVEQEFERLRRWCDNQWHYVGVCVVQVDEDDRPLTGNYDHACWGVESDCDDYLDEVADDLIDEIVRQVEADALVAAHETAETAYWASRDVVTKGCSA